MAEKMYAEFIFTELQLPEVDHNNYKDGKIKPPTASRFIGSWPVVRKVKRALHTDSGSDLRS